MKLIHPKNYIKIKDHKALKKHRNGRGWSIRKLLYNISNYNLYKYKEDIAYKCSVNVKELHVISNEEACIVITYCNRQNWYSFDWYVDVFGNISELVIQKIYKIMDKLGISSIIAEPYHSENRCLIKRTNGSQSVNNWYIIQKEK